MNSKLLNQLRWLLLLPLLTVLTQQAWADETSINFSELSLENGVQYTDPFKFGDTDVTITFAGGDNDGKYYTTGSGIRTYGNGTITVATSSGTITKAVFTWSSDSNKPTGDDNPADVGTYSTSDNTWTGDAESFTLTRPSGSGHWRLQKVEVTYSAGSAVTHTVTWYNNGSSYTTTDVKEGKKPTFPTNPSSCDATSTTFYGWATAEWTGKIDDISAKTIYTSADEMPAVTADGVKYYAVFAKVNYKECTSSSLTNGAVVLIVNTASKKALQTDGTWAGSSVTIGGSGTSTYIETSATDIQWTVEKSSSNYKFKNGTQYLYGSSSSPYIGLSTSSSNWTLSGSNPYQLTYNSSRYFEYYSNAFTTYKSSGTGDAYNMKFYLHTVSDYLTTCCQNLGQIKGSVKVNQ